MSDFIKKLAKRVCKPLKVTEYTIPREKMRGAIINEADIRPNFSKELLQEGFVEFPVYRDQKIVGLGRGGKFCDYDVQIYGVGNLVEITQSYGELEFNMQDRRYIKRTAQHQLRVFRFFYDYNEKRFKQENNEARWKQLLEEANDLLFHEEVDKALWGFIDFYEDYWIEHEVFKFQRKMTPIVTLLDLKEYCHYLWYKCVEMNDFFTILGIFREITETEKTVLVESVNRLKAEIDDMHMYLNGQVFIHEKELDAIYHDDQHNYRLRKLENTIKRAFKPGFYIDPFKEELYRNVGQYYASMLPTKYFSNSETTKELKDKLIKSAENSLAIKGITKVETFDDLEFTFIDL